MQTVPDKSTEMPATGVSSLSPLAAKLDGDPRFYWYLVTFLVAVSALGSFVNDMYSPALPSMCRFFGCSVPLAQTGLATGMVGLALGQLVLGPVSDRCGRMPVLYVSVAIFIVAAVASLFSPTIHVFNSCRLFQGFGASGGYFLARTIPADIYSGRSLAKLMALIGAINGIAPASAPVIGGVTADAFGWKGVFVVLAGFAVLVLLMSFFMKESLAPAARQGGNWRESLKCYLSLLRNKPFMVHVCFKGVALGLLFAYIASSPFIMQDHYGMSQTGYGLIVGLNALFMAGGSMLALRFRPLKKAAFAGSVFVAAGTAAEVFALYLIESLIVYEIFLIVILFGLGLIFTTSNTLAMNEGRGHAGEASSVLGIAGYVVGAVVTPLSGVGNVLHSSAIVFAVLAALILAFSFASRALAPDLGD